ncbi:MAG TPA: histone H1 [Thermoanaerobaculia bacterium]|nr:histone H1 [Thermoanaerobaculia bacterium]
MGKKPDFTQVAFRVAQQATRQVPAEECEPSSPKAAAGRKGGLKGGKARAAKLTPEERSEAARKAARSRWSKDV